LVFFVSPNRSLLLKELRMKRSSVPRVKLLGLAAGAAAASALFASGCRPDNSVAPGAPVLNALVLVQPNTAFNLANLTGGAVGNANPPAFFSTSILPTTADCAGTVSDGGTCDPAADALCRQLATHTWCSCGGTWSCAPLSDVVAVIAVFDRLLDTAPLDPGDAGQTGRTDLATLSTSTAGTPAVPLLTDYSASGAPAQNSLVFSVLQQFFFANNRVGGPTLFVAPQPEFPSGTAVTVMFDKSKLLAKDGKTVITGMGFLQDPTLVFATAPFAANISAPPPPPPPPVDAGDAGDAGVDAQDAGTDATDASADAAPPPPAPSAIDKPVAVVFTNFIDPSTIAAHVTVTANGALLAQQSDPNVPGDYTVQSDGTVLAITPTATWPANASITVTIDATAADLLLETLGTAATLTFMTAAM
jgi:hypothetical protein